MRKHCSTYVRGDRIPILSLLFDLREYMTESELCPPGPCIIYLIVKEQYSSLFIEENTVLLIRGGNRIPILSLFCVISANT